MPDKNSSSAKIDEAVFPLPLSAFEYYMFLDDRTGNTMTLPLSILIEGKIDHVAIEKAYFEACELHPLFCATISKRDRCWHKVDNPEGIIWLDANTDNAFSWDEQHIDITQSAGLRFAIADRGDSCVFNFLFHHCIADGVGYFQFIVSLFSCYLNNIGQNIAVKKYDAVNLKNRSKFKLAPPPQRVSFFSALKFLVVETFRWFVRRPLAPISTPDQITRLAAKEQSREKRDFDIAGERVEFDLRRWGNSGFIFARLSRDLTSRIIGLAKSCKFTVGDILLSGLFISLANSKCLSYSDSKGNIKEIQGDEFLRIGLVNNMRGLDAAEIPACNMISYSFPTRRFADCRNDADFYKKISDELRYIKDYNVGKTFIDGLLFFMRIPFFVDKFICSSRCLASVILSSMNRTELLFPQEFPRDEFGRVCIGGLKLVEFCSAAPYRRGTPLSITTNTYAGQLGFFIQYNTEKISPKDTANWLTEWLNEITKDHS
ncbi:MAG: hypothetical protein LBK06_04410 [Planctomycetaceae bacterium]|jgi:hypothetical protein|nr:hypothetical protein [Planctomycetaceae bacterium]